MDKLLIHFFVFFVIVLLGSTLAFSVINMLREDPLSPGILDMFFRKYSIIRLFPKREFICLNFAQIFNSFNSNNPS
jgi:hypothetical protein